MSTLLTVLPALGLAFAATGFFIAAREALTRRRASEMEDLQSSADNNEKAHPGKTRTSFGAEPLTAQSQLEAEGSRPVVFFDNTIIDTSILETAIRNWRPLLRNEQVDEVVNYWAGRSDFATGFDRFETSLKEQERLQQDLYLLLSTDPKSPVVLHLHTDALRSRLFVDWKSLAEAAKTITDRLAVVSPESEATPQTKIPIKKRSS
jgi:hypothetical protein